MNQENKQRLFNYFHELTDGKVMLMEDDYVFIENTISNPMMKWINKKMPPHPEQTWRRIDTKNPLDANLIYDFTPSGILYGDKVIPYENLEWLDESTPSNGEGKEDAVGKQKLWAEADKYLESLPKEDRSVERGVGFYDCLCRMNKEQEAQASVARDGDSSTPDGSIKIKSNE